MNGVVGTNHQLGALGIESDIPAAGRRVQINRFIFDELVCGQLKESTRSVFDDIIAEGQSQGCDAVVLGCTEIPLLINDEDSQLPTLDSTRILARASLREAARDRSSSVA